MTVNELMAALAEYRDMGAGNVHVLVVPDTDSENVLKRCAVRFVFPSVHGGRTLNVLLGVSGRAAK
jgi:hypothetical protein